MLLAACTVPNPDFIRASAGGSDGGTVLPGTGGEPGVPGGGGMLPYETGGAGGSDIGTAGAGGGVVSGTGGAGGLGGGSPGGVPDAQLPLVDGGAGGSGGATDARVDGMTPVGDTGAPIVDQRTDAVSSPPDVAPTMDVMVPTPDAVVDASMPVMDTAPPPPDVASTPDATTTPDMASAPDVSMSATNGLRADYHTGQNFETYVFTRIDQVINFNWTSNGAGPDPRVGNDNFSVRWTGYVEPRYTGTYTFSTVTDDGARLWIDGVNYIDKWTTQSGVEHTAVVDLVANRRYAIRMEYFDRAYTGSAQLFWRSALQPKEIVPYTRLWTP
ncbi:MAG TPA: PA14 domain-containing protein [Polyangia bacterium]